MAPRWLLLVSLCAVACAGGPRTDGRSQAATPSLVIAYRADDSGEPPPDNQQPASSDPLRTEIRELAHPLCTIAAGSEGWLVGVPLRFRPAGPAFARVYEVAAKLALSAAGTQAGGRIAIEADGISLRGRVNAKDLALTPARALTLGVVVPKSGARLAWIGVESGRPRVSFEIHGPLRPPNDAPFEWAAECGDLSLAARSFDARTVTGLGKPIRTEYIDAADPLVITTDPGGGASLSVVVEPGDHAAEVHASQQGRAKILFENENCLLFGWIDAKHLRSHKLGSGGGYGTGRGGLGRRIPKLARRRCDQPVELFALIGERAEARGVVGAIDAGTDLWLVPTRRAHGYVDLEKLPSWLTVAEGARLTVSESVLRDCRDPAAPADAGGR
jgi:hypothetical protein